MHHINYNIHAKQLAKQKSNNNDRTITPKFVSRTANRL